MSLQEIVVTGTLKPDGTLDLDQKLNLAPGRVTVVLRQESEAGAARGLVAIHATHPAQLETAGGRFMNEEEVNAHIEWLRAGDSIDELLRESPESSTGREQA